VDGWSGAGVSESTTRGLPTHDEVKDKPGPVEETDDSTARGPKRDQPPMSAVTESSQPRGSYGGCPGSKRVSVSSTTADARSEQVVAAPRIIREDVSEASSAVRAGSRLVSDHGNANGETREDAEWISENALQGVTGRYWK
jgi:hypothetical protein